jgi:excisionase family DNA binding protein
MTPSEGIGELTPSEGIGELWTIDETAARLSVSRRTVYHWMTSRQISWIRLPGRGRRVVAASCRGLLQPGALHPIDAVLEDMAKAAAAPTMPPTFGARMTRWVEDIRKAIGR